MHGATLAVHKPWLALAGPFLSISVQRALKRLLCQCRGSVFGTLDSIQSGEAFTGQKALNIIAR